MKRKLGILLALCMIILLLPGSASAAGNIASGLHDGGPIEWTLSDKGVLTISGNRSMQGEKRGKYAWQEYADKITRVVIGEGIPNIPDYMCYELPNLKSVQISSTVTRIGDSVFFRCPKLSEVTIPAGVTEMGTSVFRGCTGLKEIKFESGFSMDSIPESTFSGSGLTKITLPASVVTIESYAFSGCKNLKEIEYEDGCKLETIERYAFSGTGFTEVMLPPSVRTIYSEAYSDCKSLVEASLPEGVELLDGNLFRGSSVERISLPSSVKNVSNTAFNCFCPTYIINTSCDLSEEFRGNEYITTVIFGDQVKEISSYQFRDCENLSSVTLSNSIKTIDSGAFCNCTALKEISLPDGLETINNTAFASTGLTSIEIPDSVTVIGGYVFKSCTNLESVKLGKNTATIGVNAFEGCTSLAKINLDSVVSIGDKAFMGCTALTSFNLGKIENIGGWAFQDCTSLRTVVFPETLKKLVNADLFYGCTSLTEVELPDSLTIIPNAMFIGCASLKEITIPVGIKNVFNYVFSGCDAMEAIYFEGNAPTFEPNSFAKLTCDAYYPPNDPTWTEEVMQGYGGDITWYEAHEHIYSDDTVVTDPTCTDLGYTSRSCEICGKLQKFDYVDALGHNYGDPAFFSKEEGHHYECERCGYVKKEACTFDDGKLQTEAAPDALGAIKYTCAVCGGGYESYFPCRIFGATRYDTAYMVADYLKENQDEGKFRSVVVANGDDFADALSGSYLANQKNAPILLVKNRNKEINLVKDYIKANLTPGGTVYLLGGVNAVPKAMESGLEGFNVKRLAGATRYETNLEILKEAGISGNDILVCTGLDFADGLSASAVNKPILLVKDSLRATQVNYLKTLGTKNFYLIGGTNAVNTRIENALKTYGTTQRIEGATRYYTSVNIAKTFFPNAKTAVLAYAQNFPDGLSGGCLACSMNAPLILTANGKQAPAVAYAKEAGITGGAVLGGTGLIPDKVANAIFQIS